MMVLIKNKRLFIFILFTLVLLVTSFKKLVESSSQYTDISEQEYIYNVQTRKGNATNPICLSVNCNRPVNINFNENSNNGNTYDAEGDLAAYCCKACRNSGGLEYDENCIVSGGSCNTTYDSYKTSIVEGMTDNCDGIIDNGENICYNTEENSEMLETPSLDNPESCGPYSFYQCFKDPSCANYMNNINMSSYEHDEPQKNEKWQSNITNMLSFNYFNDLDNQVDEDGTPNKTLNGNFCNELCIKARESPPNKIDDENGYNMWYDLHDRMNHDDADVRNAATCEKSNAVWRAKMLCNGCKMFMRDGDGNNLLTNDANYRKISCRADSSYNNTKEIQDKQSIIETDNNGLDRFKRFVESKDIDTGIFTDLELVDDDITTAENILNAGEGESGWVEGERTINDIEFGCRLNCAYDMHDNCFSGEPNNDEINTIKTQCREACDKRLPAWVYYGSAIGNGDNYMADNNGWLNVNNTPKTWSEWRNIFSPDQ